MILRAEMGVFDGCAPSYIFRVVFKAFDFQPFRLLIQVQDLPQREAGFSKPRFGGGAGGLDRRATASSEPTEREPWKRATAQRAGVL